ncbi:MAG: glycosyltransferase [Armatimonadota bacterium]
MRILEIITPSRIAGAETQFVTILQELSRAGDELTVFCPAGRAFTSYLAEKGFAPVSWKTCGKADPRTLIRLARLIKSRNIDVVHTHLSTASLLGSFAARMAGKPCVAMVQGFNKATCYRWAHKLIAVCNGVKEHLIAQGVPADRIEVVYNSVPSDAFRPVPIADAKRSFGFDPFVPRVGAFRRMDPEKGLDLAIRAWKNVVQKHPHAKLMLAGEGKAEADLRALVHELRLNDSIEFPGFVPDGWRMMSACDALLLPSLKEACALAALEAMALARPVIVSDASGLAEIVEDGISGLVVPRGQIEPLANAIIRVLDDPSLAQRLSHGARRRVEERFDSKVQVAAIRKALAESIYLKTADQAVGRS